ncbi:MAG: acetate--CoA ligase [Desulfitobacteriaceae bacterium]
MNSRSFLTGQENLMDYDQTYTTFQWVDVEREMQLDPGGKLNIAFEAVDRKATGSLKHKNAFRFYDGQSIENLTYHQLKLLTNQFANVVRGLGLDKGERVALFLPPVKEFYIAFLGGIKFGAIIVPLSPALMPDAITEMLNDCEATLVVTTKRLFGRIEQQKLPSVRHIVLVDEESLGDVREDIGSGPSLMSYRTVMAEASDSFIALEMNQESPMMLLYTSGSTGRPKGVIHVHGGITHYYQTGKWVLDLHDQDVYWCTCEPSWIPGISYGIWAPLLRGVTSIIYFGEFAPERWYEILDKYRINVWYTTPTALRRLMNFGPEHPRQRYGLKTLRHILSVGEPLNPVVIRWSDKVFGLKVYDTWWMTETGGQIISNFRCLPVKPGSMGRPIPGIYASVVDDQGRELPPLGVGQLAIRTGWPALMRGIWKDDDKYREYFRIQPWYLTGDLAYKDVDGYFWYQGRVDDVIKKAGERLGPNEIENKLIEHPAVLEAGVIGKPDPLWGETIKAFVVLRPGHQWSEQLQSELQGFVESRLGAHFVPREIEVRHSLPRTNSGKIMRRVLKAMELGLPFGDLSTMDD